MAAALSGIAAIIAGIIVALIFVVAVEWFSAVVHPVPPDFRGTMEEMCLHVARFPHWVLALVVPAWAGTAFASTTNTAQTTMAIIQIRLSDFMFSPFLVCRVDLEISSVVLRRQTCDTGEPGSHATRPGSREE